MPQSLTQNQATQLQSCLSLAQDPTQHRQADQTFSELIASVGPNSAATEVLTTIWKEILSARRSAAFWQQISDVEKAMSEQLVQKHLQLQQNHLRLMQEQ